MYCTLHMYVGMYLVYVLKQVGNYVLHEIDIQKCRRCPDVGAYLMYEAKTGW